MKVTLLVVISVFFGLVGSGLGMAIGGLGICATSVDSGMIVGVAGCGIVTVVIGAPFGRPLGWVPPAAYCLPIALIGGLVPILLREWDRLIVAWASVLGVGLVYAFCFLLFGPRTQRTDGN